ncbi:hypothetical protein Shyhy02_25570 [Streptomyces hygroscopicus subsp. hygroscopicus]|nr:hypothetical protein Shyhy02_25570 [Streptomyces hygroscopicus subsp. hygroscopicus]
MFRSEETERPAVMAALRRRRRPHADAPGAGRPSCGPPSARTPACPQRRTRAPCRVPRSSGHHGAPPITDWRETLVGKHGGKPDPAESDGHKPDKPIPPPDPRRPETPPR